MTRKRESERKIEEATGAEENCAMRRLMIFQRKLSKIRHTQPHLF